MNERAPANDLRRTVTCILNDLQAGRREASDQLLPLVYDQLRAIAQQRMNEERAGHTLQATALVHEAYLRLVGDRTELVIDQRQGLIWTPTAPSASLTC